MKNVRWSCPNGCAGVLAPSRPRMDDVRRYCLACSARTGRLVARVAAALERAKEVRQQARRDRKVVREEAMAIRQAAYYTVAGVNLHEEMVKMLRAEALKGIRSAPKLRVRRARVMPSLLGRAWVYENRLQVSIWPGVTAEIVREVLMHELAHLATPGAGHSVRWKTTYRLACEQHFGVRPRVERRFCGEVATMLTPVSDENVFELE